MAGFGGTVKLALSRVMMSVGFGAVYTAYDSLVLGDVCVCVCVYVCVCVCVCV
jgi:hypothetical protein